jgi:tRNA pseudouridine55 synthase
LNNGESAQEPCGILVVDKEKGITSHDVVQRLRRRLGVRRVGHAGTLDPNATGVLVLLIGKATKRSNEFLGQDKEYVATVRLGETRDTDDSDGEVTSRSEVNVSPEELQKVLGMFIGVTEQVPPMYSAVKIKGKKLYELARKGRTVDREPRRVEIKEIELMDLRSPVIVLRVLCGKGTYIRQLARDIGEKLGCGAYLEELRRTRSGGLDLSMAIASTGIMTVSEKEILGRMAGETA